MCKGWSKGRHSRRQLQPTTQQHRCVGPCRQADLIRRGDGKAKEGEEKMFALAGLYGDNNNHLNTVEEGGPQLGPEKSLLWRSGNL